MVSAAREALAIALHGGVDGQLLDAVGRLVLVDDQAPPLPTMASAAIVAVLDREAVRDALEEAAVRLHEILDDDSDDAERLAREAPPLLAIRDAAERELLGAALLLGCSVDDLERASSVRLEFDALVRPRTWELVAMNGLRQAALAAMTPRLRARFWWWHDGAGLDPRAVAALGRAAPLVARFPAARAHFESLVRAETIWTGTFRPGVTSLRAWLRTRTTENELPLAAAGDDEHRVLETPDVEISFAPPDHLVLDLLSARRSDARPSLRSGAVVLVASSVREAYERFAFDLPEEVLEGKEVVLSIPLVDGDLEIVLPA